MESDDALSNSALGSQQLVGAKVIAVQHISRFPSSSLAQVCKPVLLMGRAPPCQLLAPPGVSCTLFVCWLGG